MREKRVRKNDVDQTRPDEMKPTKQRPKEGSDGGGTEVNERER